MRSSKLVIQVRGRTLLRSVNINDDDDDDNDDDDDDDDDDGENWRKFEEFGS